MDAVASDALWTAVGDPTRRRVVDLLLARGEATATALADQLPVTRQAVAKHLGVLRRVGLVVDRRDGREVIFAVRPERVAQASQAMAAAAAAWDQRLDAIKRMAEAEPDRDPAPKTPPSASPGSARRRGRPERGGP